MRFRDDLAAVSRPSNMHHLAQSGVFAEKEKKQAKEEEESNVEGTLAARGLWDFVRQHRDEIGTIELGGESARRFLRRHSGDMARLAASIRAENDERWERVKQRLADEHGSGGASAPGGEALTIRAIRNRWSSTRSSVRVAAEPTRHGGGMLPPLASRGMGMGMPVLSRHATAAAAAAHPLAPAVSRTRSV